MKSASIVFLKYPEPGKVKTRLAAETSEDFAADFYKLCAEHILSESSKLKSDSIDTFLFFENGKDYLKVREWAGDAFNYSAQKGKDLGEKMAASFQEMFNLGYEKVIIIGTDVPSHTHSDLLHAFEILSTHDAVLGPSPDGGYYLLGTKKFYPELFKDIEYSTNKVYEKTKESLEYLQLNFCLLKEKLDIDLKEDLDKWLAARGGNEDLKLKIKAIYKFDENS